MVFCFWGYDCYDDSCVPAFVQNGGCAVFDDEDLEPTSFVSEVCVMNCEMEAMQACGIDSNILML